MTISVDIPTRMGEISKILPLDEELLANNGWLPREGESVFPAWSTELVSGHLS